MNTHLATKDWQWFAAFKYFIIFCAYEATYFYQSILHLSMSSNVDSFHFNNIFVTPSKNTKHSSLNISRIVFHLGQKPSPASCLTPWPRRCLVSAGPQGCVEQGWRDTNTFTPTIQAAGETRRQAQTHLPVCKGNNTPWGILFTNGSCFYPNWDSFLQHSPAEKTCVFFFWHILWKVSIFSFRKANIWSRCRSIPRLSVIILS